MAGSPARWKHAANQLSLVNGRQRQVLDLIDRGLTNQQIADQLGLTLVEAKSEVSHLLAVLALSTREDVAEFWAWHRSRRSFDFAPLAKVGGMMAACLVGAFVVLRGCQTDDHTTATLAPPLRSPTSVPAALVPTPGPTLAPSLASLGLGDYAVQFPAKGVEGRLAFLSPRGDLMMKPMPDGAATKVRSANGIRTPSWSFTGNYIAFVESGHLVVADDQGHVTPLTQPGIDADWAWSPMGDLLAFFSPEGMVLYDPAKPAIRLIRGAGAPYPERPGGLVWSPDGTRILYGVFAGYTSPGRLDITELRTYDLATGRDSLLIEESIPAKGGTDPLGWSGDGKWVFYREPPGF
ncbi:MAG: hypothetical protein ABI577_12875, partial [bacterium]